MAGDTLYRLRAAWDRFWFEPTSPQNLGLCRILFFGLLSLYFLQSDYSVLGGDVSPLFWRPVWLHRRVLPLRPPSENTVAVVQVAWKVALALSCAGFLTRVSTLVAFAGAAFLLGLPFDFGVTSHMTAATFFVLGIMALSRCGDAWSIDGFLRRRRNIEERGGAMPADGEYTWPVRLVWVLLSLVFFGAGVSKLRHSGLAWMAPETMQQLLRLANHPAAGPATPPLTDWGLALAEHPVLCGLMGVATVVFEAGYPLALVGPRLRVLFAGSMVLMLVSVRILLGPPFELLIVCHVFWVPWDRVADFLRRRLRRAPPPSAAAA